MRWRKGCGARESSENKHQAAASSFEMTLDSECVCGSGLCPTLPFERHLEKIANECAHLALASNYDL